MALLSRFSHARLCVTPETAAHQVRCPWDSPRKNTGMGCYFLLQCMKVKSESEVAQSCPTPKTNKQTNNNNPSANAGDMRRGFDPQVRQVSWRRAWQFTPVFLPGELHGQRILADYNTWGGRVRHDWSDLARTHHLPKVNQLMDLPFLIRIVTEVLMLVLLFLQNIRLGI